MTSPRDHKDLDLLLVDAQLRCAHEDQLCLGAQGPYAAAGYHDDDYHYTLPCVGGPTDRQAAAQPRLRLTAAAGRAATLQLPTERMHAQNCVATGTFGMCEGDRSGGAARAGAGRRSPLFCARRIARVLTHTSRAVWTAPAAPAATGALPRSPTPPPTHPWQTPTDIGSSHALEDGPGAQPALAGRRAGPPPPARPPALALSRAQRPAGGTLGPAAHGSGCPICPQPTCPPLSHTHLTGCQLVAGGSGQRHGSSTA